MASGAASIRIGNRGALFSEFRQKLFDIDGYAETMLAHLEQGATARELIQSFINSGIETSRSAYLVRSLLALWSKEGLVTANFGRVSQLPFNQSIGLGGVEICLSYGNASLENLIAPIFDHLRIVVGASPISSYHIYEDEDLVLVVRDALLKTIVAKSHAVSTIKACIVDDILNAQHRIALHTASLALDGRCLLLSGPPGAGKSTLAVALASAGWSYASDDIVLLDERGRAQGVAFNPTLKMGSWELLHCQRRAIAHATVHDRADGERVRYPALPTPVRLDPLPVGMIVFLSRAPSADARLCPVDPLAALTALMQGAYSKSGRTRTADLEMLIGLVTDATCLELHYAELDDAVRLLTDAVRTA